MSTSSCADFLEFEERLKRLRLIDDKILYELNAALPTDSFSNDVARAKQCEVLYRKLSSAYNERDSAIRGCIAETQLAVDKLRGETRAQPEAGELAKLLRKEQTKLRQLQSELNVEEVVKDRSLKVFNERCRSVFKPPPDERRK